MTDERRGVGDLAVVGEPPARTGFHVTAQVPGPVGVAGPVGVSEPDLRAILELEAVAARSWCPPDHRVSDGWLLRAAGGWTNRANSAVPGDPDVLTVDGLSDALPRIRAWYRQRGLRARLALPDAVPASHLATSSIRGWTTVRPTVVMTAGVDDALVRLSSMSDRPSPAADRPVARTLDRMDDAWRAAFEQPGPPLTDEAVAVLRGGDARFTDLSVDGRLVGIARSTCDAGWVGVTAMEIRPASRRRGFGRHLLASVLRAAQERGASRAWLQVARDNDAARALYAAVGFRPHHHYHYHLAPDDGDDT